MATGSPFIVPAKIKIDCAEVTNLGDRIPSAVVYGNLTVVGKVILPMSNSTIPVEITLTGEESRQVRSALISAKNRFLESLK